ncbi:unnamed protein product [Vitrella brassicaformis CCMP3155]|uniref:Solute-binding protein family 3/N-terminal domain-containing protein n=2 Tax=Vitrella brassicaformis TaxID=1169539 RepID=A0A0G4EHA2_VITBC|nr:unnamed protein product [Vitrella brassicaformis CCMP3155]|mmetsp:Transcript_22932/g.56640  ORF Transcript_22932/g.56640 Transcript_22932/m.56640 type:complete len:318 (+) Transcript_22932:39-992(+)|eukprot:CEL95400.1 unnamed protein product [Vitrella brassicaformis CCMP3155]
MMFALVPSFFAAVLLLWTAAAQAQTGDDAQQGERDPAVVGDIGDVQLNAAISAAISQIRDGEAFLSVLDEHFPTATKTFPSCEASASYPPAAEAEGTFAEVLEDGVLVFGLPANATTIQQFNIEVDNLIVDALSSHYGVDISPKFVIVDNLADFFVPFREAMNVGEADVLTWFTVTERRAHSVDYTSCSLVNFVNEVGVWVLDSSELAGTNLTAKPDALDGMKVGVCDNCFYISDFTKTAPGVLLEEHAVFDMVPALKQGKVDGVATILAGGPGLEEFLTTAGLVKLEGSFVLGNDTRAAATRYAGPDGAVTGQGGL